VNNETKGEELFQINVNFNVISLKRRKKRTEKKARK
jgi:hypothetical protein